MPAGSRLRPVRHDHIRVPQLVAVRASLGRYLGDGAQGLYLRCHRLVAGEKAEERPVGTVVIGIAGDRTCEITHFETAISPYFGLPRTLNWIGIRRHAGLSF
jgi:hypothetical protein